MTLVIHLDDVVYDKVLNHAIGNNVEVAIGVIDPVLDIKWSSKSKLLSLSLY
jgi:hypothetical protein